jgi:hypothetical protein
MLRTVSVIALLCVLSLPARADDTSPDQPVESYRLQTGIVDGIALSMLLLRSQNSGPNWDTLIPLGLTLAAVPPLIHAYHGRGWHAVESVGLRLAIPVLGAVLAKGQDCGPYDDSCYSHQEFREAWGFGIGLGVAMLADTLLLAGGDDRARRVVTPTVVTNKDGGMTFGLAGRF